jgi:hypothetical protein
MSIGEIAVVKGFFRICDKCFYSTSRQFITNFLIYKITLCPNCTKALDCRLNIQRDPEERLSYIDIEKSFFSICYGCDIDGSINSIDNFRCYQIILCLNCQMSLENRLSIHDEEEEEEGEDEEEEYQDEEEEEAIEAEE